ncbi:MAG: FHA domain-containing protein [Acidobacteriota bacterium]
MNTDNWSCPDVDEHGFILFDTFKQQAAGLSQEQFLAAFPRPALVTVFSGGDPESGEALDPTSSGVQLLTVSIKSTAILRYLGKLAFVAKRPGNPFAHLISVGRSASNDITLAVDSVSKVHGYFVQEGPHWFFTDHDSTNGTALNGSEITAGEKYPLFDGSVIQLGVEAMVEFVSPESLFRKTLNG